MKTAEQKAAEAAAKAAAKAAAEAEGADGNDADGNDVGQNPEAVEVDAPTSVWFRNKVTGIELEIIAPEVIKDLRRDVDTFEAIDGPTAAE